MADAEQAPVVERDEGADEPAVVEEVDEVAEAAEVDTDVKFRAVADELEEFRRGQEGVATAVEEMRAQQDRLTEQSTEMERRLADQMGNMMDRMMDRMKEVAMASGERMHSGDTSQLPEDM